MFKYFGMDFTCTINREDNRCFSIVVSANRLALMDVKTMLITLVSDYALHPCARTKNHFEFDRETFTLNPKGEVWLRLKKRN